MSRVPITVKKQQVLVERMNEHASLLVESAANGADDPGRLYHKLALWMHEAAIMKLDAEKAGVEAGRIRKALLPVVPILSDSSVFADMRVAIGDQADVVADASANRRGDERMPRSLAECLDFLLFNSPQLQQQSERVAFLAEAIARHNNPGSSVLLIAQSRLTEIIAYARLGSFEAEFVIANTDAKNLVQAEACFGQGKARHVCLRGDFPVLFDALRHQQFNLVLVGSYFDWCHLAAMRSGLAQMFSLLKPGGELAFAISNRGAGKFSFGHLHPDHDPREMSRQELLDVFKEAGVPPACVAVHNGRFAMSHQVHILAADK